ncbi:hypothetical protein EVAR_89343_1 [Eumeta japonica]|uniref:Uncharacterized protein n=1 Tax=Eumeta variegata TaxID=151549 RepID=A0A4C1Y5K7_EUMVA|nr:hypothetical protein EVAR_89343_1 [Eumeta japonica]
MRTKSERWDKEKIMTFQLREAKILFGSLSHGSESGNSYTEPRGELGGVVVYMRETNGKGEREPIVSYTRAESRRTSSESSKER